MAQPLTSSAQRVQEALLKLGSELTIVELPHSTRTAAAAAEAIGCSVAQIAKSLVFTGDVTGEPALAVLSGINRVDRVRLGALVGEPVRMASPDFVREHTGYAIGGVPPIGHARPITTWIDECLLELDCLWAAAGTPRSVFRLTPQELVSLTGGVVAKREQLLDIRSGDAPRESP